MTLGGTCLSRQQYRFSYDYANRLTAADHWTHNGTVWANTNNYSESNITFDLNGNIKTYTRRGLVTAPSTYGVIDQLTYTYGDAARPDRLTNMADVGSNTKGFFHTPAAAAYQYDLNGNMTQDNHKGFIVSTKRVGKSRSDNHLKSKLSHHSNHSNHFNHSLHLPTTS